MTGSVLLDGLVRTQTSYGERGSEILEELVAVRRLLIAEVAKSQRLELENAQLKEALKRYEPLEVLRDSCTDGDT